LVAACGAEPIRDVAGLSSALQRARSGDTIDLGRCTLNASFTVPAGVSLVGEGSDVTRIEAPAGSPALVIMPGSTATQIAQLSVDSGSRVAILARGSGKVAIRDVKVDVRLGIGIGVEAVDVLAMSSVSIAGPVTASNASAIPPAVTSTESATYGLVLVRVRSAELDDLAVNGFASAGALFSSSTVAWSRGNASSNLGLGVYVEAGQATLTDVAIDHTMQGLGLIPAYAGAFTRTARVDTHRLHVGSGEGFGLLQDSGTARHLDLDAEDNTGAAVWSQHAASVEVSGTLARNGFAGVVAVDSQMVSVHDATIDSTQKVVRILEETGTIQVGDGVQLVRSADGAHLSQVSLSNNGRVGVLLELGGATAVPSVFDHVIVTASTGAFGAVIEDGMGASGWDSGITRMGVDAAADYAESGHLPSVQGVGPCERPRDTHLADMGLQLLTGM
jgi:hypothetical protein